MYLATDALSQFCHFLRIEIAPGKHQLDGFLGFRKLVLQLFFPGTEQLHTLQQLLGRKLLHQWVFCHVSLLLDVGVVEHLQRLLIALFQRHGVAQLVACGSLLQLVHVHNAQLANAVDKAFIFPVGDQERQLFHFLNHEAASFLFSWSDFRIF